MTRCWKRIKRLSRFCILNFLIRIVHYSKMFGPFADLSCEMVTYMTTLLSYLVLILYLYCIHFLHKASFFPENRDDYSSWIPSKLPHHLSPIILGMNPWIFVIVNLWIVKTFCPSFKRFISIKTRLIDGVAQFNIGTYCRPLPVHLVLGLLLLGVHR